MRYSRLMVTIPLTSGEALIAVDRTVKPTARWLGEVATANALVAP